MEDNSYKHSSDQRKTKIINAHCISTQSPDLNDEVRVHLKEN